MKANQAQAQNEKGGVRRRRCFLSGLCGRPEDGCFLRSQMDLADFDFPHVRGQLAPGVSVCPSQSQEAVGQEAGLEGRGRG